MVRGIWVRALLTVLLGLSLCNQAAAEEQRVGYTDGVTRKLGRGVANALTGPLELIREPTLTAHRDGGLAGLTIGMVRGIGAGVLRTASGVVDVVTFLVPFPGKHFEPIWKPEFIYAHGDWAS